MATSLGPIDFFYFAFQRAESEYADLNEIWKQLDSKAQGTAALAGVFIAAIFAFVRNTSLQLDILEKIFLLFVLAILVCVIGIAAKAMKVQIAAAPLEASELAETVRRILVRKDLDSSIEEYYANLLSDTLETFSQMNLRLRVTVRNKAEDLLFSQRMLAYSAILFAALTTIAVFRH